MSKTKSNKRKIKYSRKAWHKNSSGTYRKKNNPCEKGITDEVVRIRKLIKQLRIHNQNLQKKINT